MSGVDTQDGAFPGNLAQAPDEPAGRVHVEVTGDKNRRIKVDRSPNTGTLHVGIVYPRAQMAKATVRLTKSQAIELVAALEGAIDAIDVDRDAYIAQREAA